MSCELPEHESQVTAIHDNFSLTPIQIIHTLALSAANIKYMENKTKSNQSKKSYEWT